MVGKTTDRTDLEQTETLGNLRLRHHETNEIVLIPTPSSDPNDPLNWSRWYRYYIACIVCLAMFFCNFLAAGPTVALVDQVVYFYGPPGPKNPDMAGHIAKVAYFFTTTALMQGMGDLLWMPLIVKYGRRPIYVIAFTGYTATAFWCGFAKTYKVELAGRILMGVFAGAGEVLAPLTIVDTFYLHERGAIMAFYTAALSCGVSGGIVIAGLITIAHSWRYIYYVAVALIGALTLLVIFTFPETTFNRSLVASSGRGTSSLTHTEESKRALVHTARKDSESRMESPSSSSPAPLPSKMSYLRSLRIFTGTYTEESLFGIFLRPVILLSLPPVLWATLVMSVTIGFLVAISSNFASAFAEVYLFQPYQAGLCFIAALVGSWIGIFFGGPVSDSVADYFTRMNNGIREPEMRLPSMLIGGIAAPVGLVLYGEGIGKQLHWMIPTLGLALLNFAITQATNVTLVYTVDAYRPVAGEVTVSQLGFKGENLDPFHHLKVS
ncbi:MAG: hypothetical protein Q9227_001273 [Pyrenula ochraceoflavens]